MFCKLTHISDRLIFFYLFSWIPQIHFYLCLKYFFAQFCSINKIVVSYLCGGFSHLEKYFVGALIMENDISNNSSESVIIFYDDGISKKMNKSDIKNFDRETVIKISAQSIVQYIDLFDPICLINAFASISCNSTYVIKGIRYKDTDKVAQYISGLVLDRQEKVYNRFLNADVLYICFLDKDFVKKLATDKDLFNRIKNELIEKISDNKNSYAICNFMQYIRQRHDYNDKSRSTYVKLAFEILESVDVGLFFKEIDDNSKKITRFKNKRYEDFFYYLLDIINISGIKSLDLFAKKYADSESNLQKIIGSILKSDDNSIATKSCFDALFGLFYKIASAIDKKNLSKQDCDLFAQCLINFINSNRLVLIGLINYREYEREEKECVAKFLADQIKNKKINDIVSNLKEREDVEWVWCFIQKYYGNKNENDYFELVNNFANNLIKKDETSTLISIPAIFFDKNKFDKITKNLILKTKNVGQIIKLIEKMQYETAKLFLDFILSTESCIKENFEDELCKTSFGQMKNSNLLNYFWKNMNMPKCRDILKKLASNKDGKYKNDASNLIDSFYGYLIYEKKIGKQETDDYFIKLISEEKNVIKFIYDMDFYINNIDNKIVKENFSNAPIENIDFELDRINRNIKYGNNVDSVEFIQKRGLYVYELMMRPDIFEKLPVAEREQNDDLKPNQKTIGTKVWDIFTQTLKLKIENDDLNETECKNISNKKWFSYILTKILDRIEPLTTEIKNSKTNYDEWRANALQKELLRMVPILYDFISSVYEVKESTDELYDVIWDQIYRFPYDFFLQQTPNGNFSLQNIISYKSKLNKKDTDAIWEKIKSAYRVETDEQGKEKLVFGNSLSAAEVNIIKKKTGYDYVVNLENGKEEVVFKTDENGKLIKKEWNNSPKFFWDLSDIRDFFVKREIWKRKRKCYQIFFILDSKCIFLSDLNDISKIIKSDSEDLTCFKIVLLSQLNDKFEDTHSGFSKYFQKNTDNLTMADWLIYRLQFKGDYERLVIDLINLIYKDFDKYVGNPKDPNTKYKLINKFMSQIRETDLRKKLFSTKNNILKNVISIANKQKDILFFKLGISCLNKLKYNTKNNNEQQNFLNLFSLCSGEIINHIDVNFILDNLDNNCVWENLKFLSEKCPHQNEDGIENENHKKIRLICENKNFNGLNKLKNRHRSNSVKISSKHNREKDFKEKLWKEDEPKNVISEDKNFYRIFKTQEEYWLKLIECGPRDIIGYLDWKFIYRNLDKKLIRDHLKYINWSITFNENNSLDKIMKFIAQEEKFYTPDMEQDLNNIFWQKFKHVKDNPISNYKFLFLLNIYPEALKNIDLSFLAENLLDENIFDMEFLKTNLFQIGGEDRIKNLCEYIEKNELDPENKKNKLMLLIDSSIFAECLVYIDCDDSLINFLTEKIRSNIVNKCLSLCSGQKTNSIYQSIAKSDIDENKKIEILKMILCRISEEALDYLITQNIINQNIVNVFYGQPGNYMLSAGRRCIKEDKNITQLIKQSLKQFKVQKKQPSKKQNQQNQIDDNLNPPESKIQTDNTKTNNIIQDNLTMNQNSIVNNSNENNNLIKTTQHQNVLITDGSNINLNQQTQSQINSFELRNLSMINNFNNQPNIPPNNRKPRIWLGFIGLIFIIASIWLFFIAPKIAIISLVIGGLLFIGAIGFNKFRLCLCFNKKQIKSNESKQNQKSIDNRTQNLVTEQIPNNNKINNDNHPEHN